MAHYHHFIITSTTYALPAIAPLLPRGPIDSLRYFKLRMKQSVPSTYRTTAADIVACSVKVQTNLLDNTTEEQREKYSSAFCFCSYLRIAFRSRQSLQNQGFKTKAGGTPILVAALPLLLSTSSNSDQEDSPADHTQHL